MRRFAVLIIAMSLAMTALSFGTQSAEAVWSPLRGLQREVYFEQTGHHLSGPFLNYWWYNGGLDQFGFPLTEAIQVNGMEVQYFERARFEWHPNNPENFRILLGHLGTEVTAGRTDSAFTRYPESFSFQETKDHRYFPQTGHFLSYGFKTYWDQNGGLDIYGYPISEEFQERGADGKMRTVQYFERARFEYHPEHAGTRYEVQLGRLGDTIGKRNGIDFATVAKHEGTPIWPGGMENPPKWIEINLSLPQRITAWEGDTMVYQAFFSGGTDDNPTPVGVFEVFWKLRYDDMKGGVPGTADYYYLEDVPFVMYFAEGGYAIHGAWWHANFGYPISHGCINLTIPDAEWFYNWAPYGTKVWVHN